MLKLENVAAVCFDLDGTLADTAADLAFAVEEMLKALELPFHDKVQIKDWIGDGSERLIHRVLSRHIDGTVPAPLFLLANTHFLQAYQSRKHAQTYSYPGVETCLSVLKDRKIPLACITNMSTLHANSLLSKLGLHDAFSLIIGRDSGVKPKPSPDMLMEVADILGVSSSSLLMVGDSVNDIHAARAARCPVVCVSYGYNYGIDINHAKPDAVVDSLASLPTMVSTALTLPKRKSAFTAKLTTPSVQPLPSTAGHVLR